MTESKSDGINREDAGLMSGLSTTSSKAPVTSAGLGQEWVSRVTSEGAPDVPILGGHVPPMPACSLASEGWWCSRNSGHEGPCAARPFGVFHLEDEDGWSAGVFAKSEAAAIQHWNTEIDQHEGELTATRIPADREVQIWWIDDKPEAQDVPEGGRIEPWPQDSKYLGVIATAAQWCAYYAKSGRDFFIMWEADW